MEAQTTNITLQKIETLFYNLIENGYALALWKSPHDATIHFIFSEDTPVLTDQNITELSPSFLIAPFNAHKDQKYYAIKIDNHFQIDLEHSKVELIKQNINTDILSNEIIKNLIFSTLNNLKLSNTLNDEFQKNVAHSIEEINKNRLRKVVISRNKNVQKDLSQTIFKKFITLAKAHPSSFATLTFTASTGLWIGATPEVLIQKDKDGIFSTMALAGTQPSNGHSTKDAVWKQKEIEEQAYVSRYIINRFKEIRLREFEDIGPRTIKAGDLFHLRTDFIVNLNDVGMQDLPDIMRRSLHPTSAVCGMPRQAALEWLDQHEGYDRKLYTGYLGPINFENESCLYVNLRCAEIHQDSITFYAGAGITADSDPESEYKETELKMQTLENILLD